MIWSNFFVLVDVQTKTRKRRSALMAFCEALIATVPAYGVKPNKLISLESVHCALNENRIYWRTGLRRIGNGINVPH